ncbi:hypothetical protein HPO96_00910 [Kribbella sandramycini]|uniref:Uncharacterized protein n=1 Tax=Kribbella sandramycini TaxID=60450 RepID=A0A7Y4NY58_9ACTN|nr:hypothetical protein [Kribbella sandramycini]MBB6568620.1 hypothetical protein [Kribbella sandramycini]NOL38795.1 hypothetical protein [Kribbella sandramycini]
MSATAPEPVVPDVDGVWFQLEVDDPAAGAPYGQYHRDDDVIWAEFYAGGTLRSGRLVGRLRADGSFDASYCLLTETGELISGACHSIPEFDAQGNILVTDHFRRADGSRGVSRIRQIPSPVREV